MTLPPPEYQQPWRCERCGYVGDTGPTHPHPVARKGHLCPHPAIGGERYYTEATVRGLVNQIGGGV